MNWRNAHREAAVAAQYCHANYGVDTATQIDVFGVLREQGILTVFRPLPRLSGAYYPNDGRAGILLNANHPMSKQRYTAAHELGHHYLEHGTRVDPEIEALNRWGNRSPPQQEKVAEAFASWFLMPHRLIASILGHYDTDLADPSDAYALSLRLGTSYEATTRHLANVQLINRQLAEAWVRVPPRHIKQEIAGRWAPSDIRNDVWVVGAADDGMPVTVTPGDRLIVRVPETPSSGYSWAPAEPGLPSGVTVLDEDYDSGADASLATNAHEDPVVGGSADHLILLEIVEDAPKGQNPLTFVHSQPWDPGSETNRFTLDIRIRHYVQGVEESFLEVAA